MELTVDFLPVSRMLSHHGIQYSGPVQAFVDAEVMKQMAPYTPMISGTLMQAATRGTVIGSGLIKQTTPYARYQYYGKLMVSSKTGSAWASKGEYKVLTDKNLEYTKAQHPMAGSFWFERMKQDKLPFILSAARAYSRRLSP